MMLVTRGFLGTLHLHPLLHPEEGAGGTFKRPAISNRYYLQSTHEVKQEDL